jgi:hypothetical protein
MRRPRSLALVALVPLASASFECSFDISSHHFNLALLKGLHTTWKTTETPPTIENATIFIDLCDDLRWDSDVYDKHDRCEDGTQSNSVGITYLVCVIKYNQRDDERTVTQIIPVAGSFPSHSLDAKTSLIQTTSSDEIDGVRVELHGQVYLDQQQSAVIELSCDKSIEVFLLGY